ncbi:MAG: hypothetical protein ACTSSE_19490 [Candidatus Thorarchaeota archaeon]
MAATEQTIVFVADYEKILDAKGVSLGKKIRSLRPHAKRILVTAGNGSVKKYSRAWVILEFFLLDQSPNKYFTARSVMDYLLEYELDDSYNVQNYSKCLNDLAKLFPKKLIKLIRKSKNYERGKPRTHWLLSKKIYKARWSDHE